MNIRNKQHNVGSVAVLAVFCVFICTVLTMLVFGAKTYKAVSFHSSESYELRTSLQYIAEKVRHSDSEDAVFLSSFSDMDDPDADDIQTLYLLSCCDDVCYCTRIYLYEGAIRELYSEIGSEFEPDGGSSIIPAEALHFKLSDSLLTIDAQTANNESGSISLALRCAQGGLAE